MRKFKDLLIELKACEDARTWASDMTIEEVVAKVERGDWLLWLAKRIDIETRPLTLAKARCAMTVIHLMKDERSVNAVLVAEKFGKGDATIEELNTAAAYAAAAAAYAAAYTAADTAAYAAAYTAAYAAAYTTAYAAAYTAADTAAYAAYTAADTAAARKKNREQTADICREILGSLIIEKVNLILNK